MKSERAGATGSGERVGLGAGGGALWVRMELPWTCPSSRRGTEVQRRGCPVPRLRRGWCQPEASSRAGRGACAPGGPAPSPGLSAAPWVSLVGACPACCSVKYPGPAKALGARWAVTGPRTARARSGERRGEGAGRSPRGRRLRLGIWAPPAKAHLCGQDRHLSMSELQSSHAHKRNNNHVK